MAEDGGSGVALVLGQAGQQVGGEVHLQDEVPGGVGEAAPGLGVGVAVGDVGLDVKNGRSVHQICAAHVEDGAELLGMLHPQQLDAGQAQIVGPEGGAGGEDADSGVAAQTGRAHRGIPAGADGLGKLPDDPQVGEILNAPQSVGVAELRLEDDGGLELLHQTALAGNAELGGKIGVHPGDDLNIYIFHYPHTFLMENVTAKIAARPREMAAPAEQPQ